MNHFQDPSLSPRQQVWNVFCFHSVCFVWCRNLVEDGDSRDFAVRLYILQCLAWGQRTAGLWQSTKNAKNVEKRLPRIWGSLAFHRSSLGLFFVWRFPSFCGMHIHVFCPLTGLKRNLKVQSYRSSPEYRSLSDRCEHIGSFLHYAIPSDVRMTDQFLDDMKLDAELEGAHGKVASKQQAIWLPWKASSMAPPTRWTCSRLELRESKKFIKIRFHVNPNCLNF